MVIEGVDYSFSPPTAAGLAVAGKHFACRYVGVGSVGKRLSQAEYNRLRAANIDVVANAEGSAGGFKGAAVGRSWAQQANDEAISLGMPANRPIYFSVDWNTTSADWPAIDAALNGAASVIGKDRVGVYGSYATVLHCMTAQTAKWFWQTYAWSAGNIHPAIHLYQYKNGVSLGGGDVDLTRALVADYGQWHYSQGVEDMALVKPDDNFIQGAILGYNEGGLPADLPADGNGKPANYLNYFTAMYKLIRQQAQDIVALKAEVATLSTPPPATVDAAALAEALQPMLTGIVEEAVANVLKTGVDNV